MMGRKSSPASSETTDSLTILMCCSGHSASKLYRYSNGQIEKHDFRAGMYFVSTQAQVSNIHGLSAVLAHLEKIYDGFTIRGQPLQHVDVKSWHRRIKDNYRTPESGRRYVMIDIDKLQLPDDLRLTPESIQRVVDYAISQLPAELTSITCYWQLSSSSGIYSNSVVSLHVWFWLDRPITDSALKRWAKSANNHAGSNLIDTSLFNDVQAHYTAAPQFNGMEDPFPLRSGLLLKASDAATLHIPDEALPRTNTASIKPKIHTYAMRGNSDFDGHGPDYFLGQIGDHPGGSGFHQPIIRAIASAVASAGEDGVDRALLKESVQQAVLAADRSKHDDSYILQKASDEHLDSAIDGAIKKFGRKSRLVEGCPPHYARTELEPDAAKCRLEKAIGRIFGR